MDWTALIGVIVGAVLTAATQVVLVLTRRGDRRHEVALEFAKQTGEDTRKALLAVIRWARNLRELTEPQKDQMVAYHPRANALLYSVANPMPLGDEVTAYTSLEVQRKYESLNRLLDNALNVPIRIMLGEIQKHDTDSTAAKTIVTAGTKDMSQIDESDWYRELFNAGDSVSKAMGLRDQVEQVTSNLDPNEVHRLADELITAARKGVQGI